MNEPIDDVIGPPLTDEQTAQILEWYEQTNPYRADYIAGVWPPPYWQ